MFQKILRTTLLGFILIITPTTVLAQTEALSSEARSKLDGQLQLLLERSAELQASPGLAAAVSPLLAQTQIEDLSGEVRYPVIVYTDNAAALRASGVPTNSTLGPVTTARLTLTEIQFAAEVDAVRFIAASGISESHNDEAAQEVGARTLNSGALSGVNYSGQGILTCVVDSGIDVNHGDFMDASGNTRILYLWDQTSTTTGQTPEDRSGTFSGLNYGTEYSSADIDGGSVSQEDTDGHGTHVAGTVASSGNALVLSGSQTNPEHRGVAPEADIIIVKAGNGSFSNDNIINAMTYCGGVADDQGKPLVINMSLGGNAGPHDGTSALDLAVDAFTDGTPTNGTLDPGTAPDKVVVISAGNNGGSAQHVSGTIASSSSATTPWTVGSYTSQSGVVNDYFATQKWFDTADDVTVTVTAPNGTDTATLAASGTSAEVNQVDTPSGTIYLESGVSSENGDRYFDVQVFDWEDGATEITPAEGTWQIEIQNTGAASTTYHGWTWNSTIPGQYDNGDDELTLGSPGTATGAITVAAHAHRWYYANSSAANAYDASISNRDQISEFSSPGPRRDGAVKPDISAPGQGMISAYSQDMSTVSSSLVFDQDGVHRMTQGTSMSAPVVAGAVALLLQVAQDEGRSLTANEVKQLLTDNTTVDGFVTDEGPVPNVRFGHGKLDVLAAAVDVLSASYDREVLVYHDNVGFSQTDTLTVGNGYFDSVALRFTPGIDGIVTGGIVSPDADFRSEGGRAINGTGDLIFEVWSDNGSGQPDTRLGATVAVPSEVFNQFGPNAFDMLSADVDVQQGVDYHLVVSIQNAGTGTLAFFSETNSPNGRTQGLNGSTWSPVSKDVQLRVEVASSDAGGALPVEFAAFGAQSTEDRVELSWSTATETNNAGFYVERRTDQQNARWESIGFVEGSGTTAESQTYRFTDLGIPFTAQELTYRLRQVDLDGTASYSDQRTVMIGAPVTLQLDAPYPNPVRGMATVNYQLPAAGDVTIAVYDLLGRKVMTLQDGAQEMGRKSIQMNTQQLASGTYFLRLQTDEDVLTQRLTVVR